MLLFMRARLPRASLFPYTPLFRSNHTLSLKSSVTIPETGKATVRHTFTSRNADKENLPGTATLAVSGHDVQSVSRSEEHTSELQSRENLVCRLLHEKKKKTHIKYT